MPGYGQYTGYEPISLPNGRPAYMLTTKDGTRIPAVGAEAENIRQGIDRANSAPASLAGAAPAPQPGAYQPGQGPMRPPPEGPPAQPMRIRTKDGFAELRPGGNPQDPSAWEEVVAPRSGSKGGLMEMGRTIQGGYNIDPEREAAINQSQDEIQAAAQSAAAEAQKAMLERQAFFTAAREQQSREAIEMARENSLKQQGIEDLNARYAAAEKEFLETPEKQKAARDGDKVRTIGESIASALGALGASLARTPNFAAQTIEANRERDLRREEAELRVKKEAKDSLLGRLRDEMGSLDLAKNAFRAIRTRQDALALEQIAAKTSDVQRQQEILQMAAGQNQAYQKWYEAWQRGADGEVTRSMKMQAGSAGSAGGRRPLSAEQLGSIAGVTQQYATTNKTLAETDKTKADAAAAQSESLKPVPAERTTQIAEDASLLALGNRVLTNKAIADKDSDTFEPAGSIASKVPLIGPAITTKEFKQYEQDAQNWVNRRIKFLTGAGMAETEAIRIARGEVGENKAVNRVKQGVQAGMGEAANRLKANFATLPPEQQQKLFKELPPEVQQMLKQQGGGQ